MTSATLHHLTTSDPSDSRPEGSLAASFDDTKWAHHLGCRPILAPAAGVESAFDVDARAA